jgi:cytidine deaminase
MAGSRAPGTGRDAEAAAVAAARALIAERAEEGRHHVAAAVLTETGARHLALNLESALGRAAICAEAVAIGMARTAEPGARIAFAAAVNRRGEVIPPCGLCRELLLDYGPCARVAVPGGGDWVAMPFEALLPNAYKGALRAGPARGGDAP